MLNPPIAMSEYTSVTDTHESAKIDGYTKRKFRIIDRVEIGLAIELVCPSCCNEPVIAPTAPKNIV